MTGKKDKATEVDDQAEVDPVEEEVADEPVEEPEYAPPSGPAQTEPELHDGDVAAQAIYEEPKEVEPATLEPAGEPQPNPNVVDDGVEDGELGPPVLGGWVQIISGDYAGRFAAYLGDVGTIPDDDPVKIIQVRTRDADNLVLDLPITDVTATTYSGGR